MYTIYNAKTNTQWKIMNIVKSIKELKSYNITYSWSGYSAVLRQVEKLEDDLADAYTVDNFEQYYNTGEL